MRTRMSTMGTMGMAVAFLLALTSTLSAQATESKGGPTSASSAQVSAASADFGSAEADLSGANMMHVVPLISGWCGTDTTLADDPMLKRARLQLAAALFHAGLQLHPGQIIMKALALRYYYQSTIDVGPRG
jgi:hypothetical protein